MLDGLKSLLGLKKRETREHEKLGTLTLIEDGDPYWEAEIKQRGAEPISFAIPDEQGEPDNGAIEFAVYCLEMPMQDLIGLCGQIVIDEWTLWVELDWPEDVTDRFTLVGIDAPIDGDVEGEWSASFAMTDDENHIMTVNFAEGMGHSVTFDG
ncbi:MAG: hypothetical protein Alpg2KO_02670 [Alphaproteobacteria bacterium]